jgi:hypothetical protein
MKTTWHLAALTACLAMVPSGLADAASTVDPSINLVACQHFYPGNVNNAGPGFCAVDARQHPVGHQVLRARLRPLLRRRQRQLDQG